METELSSIAVAIIFFEKTEQTIECIKSVTASPSKIYVLNNNSSKASLKRLQQHIKDLANVSIINSGINLGPAKGRNKLISCINEPWILFLDNDIIVNTPNWYTIALNHIKNDTKEDVFIPRLFNVHENKWQAYHKYYLKDGLISGLDVNDSYTNCFPGGAAIVKKAVFERLGGYSTVIRVLEDFEFSIRALINKTPIKAKLIDDIELFHHHKYAKLARDKQATRIRYEAKLYENAEEYIRNNYGIEFYSGWQSWVKTQIEVMIPENMLGKFIRRIKTEIGKVKNKVK